MSGLIVRAPAAVSLSSGLAFPGAAEPETFVRRLLDEHWVVASLTPCATRYLRFGPSIATSEDEVDRAVEAVRALARR